MTGLLRGIAAGAALVCALAAPATAAEHSALGVTRDNALEQGVLAEINTFRAQHRLSPLRVNVRLTAAAEAHSLAMARRGFFAHESADGTAFWKRVRGFYGDRGFAYWRVGENLLWSSPTIEPAEALQLWLDSPPHRKILLKREWREIGLSAVHVDSAPGIYRDSETTIITADFGVRT
jgi:uncharacterized protein YkwD